MRGNRSSDERCYVNTGNTKIPKDKLSFIPRIRTRMEGAPVANRRISKVIEVGREESFRTSLANQKQRLLKQTQLNNQFEAQKVQVDLKAKEEEKTKKKSFLGVLRKISFRTRKTSKEEPSSPPPPASPPAQLLEVPQPLFPPPPVVEQAAPPTPPPSPAIVRTPLPPDSPLLQKAPQDPILKRIRSFNKSLKKAQSFRLTRAKSKSVEKVVEPEPEETFSGKEISFKVKKTMMGRIGWRIMPEDDSLNLKMNKDILNQVLERIKDMQYCGQAVPEKITVKLQ